MQQQQLQQPQTQAKQNNLIRKTAIQTFQPMITKIQQHIAYLLQQTTKLREKNQVLQRTVMDHKIINTAIAQLKQDMNNMELKFAKSNNQKQVQAQSLKRQIVGLTLDIQKINTQLKKKQLSINQLQQKNAQQTNKLKLTSAQFRDMVEKQMTKMAILQTSNIKLQYQLKNLSQHTNSQLKILSDVIEEKQARLQQNTGKLELYLTQREEIRRFIQDIWKKVDRTVDIDRYEKEWKIIRMENQAMKKQNKRMIDEALTPDVRAFLPEMMQRMQQVRKVNRLQIILNQQKIKTDQYQLAQQQIISALHKKLQQAQQRSQQIRLQLIQKTTTIASNMSKKMQQGKDNAHTAITTLQQQTLTLISKKQKQLQQSIQSLLDRNHEKIYKMTVDLIPQQEKQFYNKMKEFLPLLESTKQEVLLRCDQITEFGKNLEQRLEGFNNRIVKIKGDLNVDLQNFKKKNKNIQNSIMVIADNFKNLGKVISAYCQMFLISFSLSFDLVSKQIYVTYNDGIIYEQSENQNQISYRKMRVGKQQLKRSALAQLIKLTDNLIKAQQYQFMLIKQHKPSDHFKSIKQGIMSSNLNITPLRNRKRQRKLSAKVIKQASFQNKLPSLDQTRTIELPATSADVSKQVFSNTLTSDLSNLRKNQRQRSYRGRYSQLK